MITFFTKHVLTIMKEKISKLAGRENNVDGCDVRGSL